MYPMQLSYVIVDILHVYIIVHVLVIPIYISFSFFRKKVQSIPEGSVDRIRSA